MPKQSLHAAKTLVNDLVMPIDEYEKVATKPGGTPETSLQLTAVAAVLEQSVPEQGGTLGLMTPLGVHTSRVPPRASTGRDSSPTIDWEDEEAMENESLRQKQAKIQRLCRGFVL